MRKRLVMYINTVLEWIGIQRRKHYIKSNQKRIHNTTPSIVSNNCIAGIIYHDLNLKFSSPTINLFLVDEDYFEFLSDLTYYLSCIPIEVPDETVSYPVGVLLKGNKEVRIHFMHYKSFEEAKEKWIERSKRVDFENLYILFEYNQELTPDNHYYASFKSLPYKNKRMLTHTNIIDEEIISCTAFQHNVFSGKILTYPHLYSKKRYLDQFDYISFLNSR